MATIISRTTFTFTVLHLTYDPPLTLDDALRDAEDGHAVGNVVSQVTEEVADDDVPDELMVLGNDGEFFDDDLERI